MAECMFCKIVQGEAPASIVYEDVLTLASGSYTHLCKPLKILGALQRAHFNDFKGL
jgi:hypothetical protein